MKQISLFDTASHEKKFQFKNQKGLIFDQLVGHNRDMAQSLPPPCRAFPTTIKEYFTPISLGLSPIFGFGTGS